VGDEYVLDWSALVPLVVHRTKVQIIEAMCWVNRPLSATELEQIFDETMSLSSISYHVVTLKKWKVLKQVRARPVRGSTERFYFFRETVWKKAGGSSAEGLTGAA
jgi:DNA-binding transcriptional regulator GbsR (MarR family)